MTGDGSDLPYYDGRPVAVDGRGWALLMASLALAFAVLTLTPPRGFPANLVPALLFAALPLAALRLAAGRHWRAPFRPVGLKQVGQMLLFGFVTLAGSALTGLLLSQVFEMTANPASGSMAAPSAGGLAAALLPTLPQLLGEELLGVLPFLAVLWLCVSRLGLSRRAGIGIGLVVSALIFGAAHLPTYGWNWPQALLGIGVARVLLTLAFVATRNLWVSTGAHIVNDWSGFLLIYVVGPMPIAPE